MRTKLDINTKYDKILWDEIKKIKKKYSKQIKSNQKNK
jgi:hypothetical protein